MKFLTFACRPQPSLLSLLLLFSITAFAEGAFIARVGTGPTCTHATIQAAIDDTDAIDLNHIVVTRSLTYTAPALQVGGKHFRMSGGYDTCDQTGPPSGSTTHSGAGGSHDSVMTSTGNDNEIVLEVDPARLVRVHGNVASQAGGGIYLQPDSGTGDYAPVFLCAANFRIDSNSAQEGAAIYADHDDSTVGGRRRRIRVPQSSCVQPMHGRRIAVYRRHAMQFDRRQRRPDDQRDRDHRCDRPDPRTVGLQRRPRAVPWQPRRPGVAHDARHRRWNR